MTNLAITIEGESDELEKEFDVFDEVCSGKKRLQLYQEVTPNILYSSLRVFICFSHVFEDIGLNKTRNNI